jgi:HAD superfamily hydrolase (TIGR01509 family)
MPPLCDVFIVRRTPARNSKVEPAGANGTVGACRLSAEGDRDSRLRETHHRNGDVVIQAIIFDLDGTLVHSEELWCRAMQQFVRVRGLLMTEAHACDLVLGKAWSDIVARLRADYPSIQEDADAIERESLGYYEASREAVDIRIPSSIRLLEQLAHRYPVAIVSGSTRQQVAAAIELMGVHAHLQFYLGSEDYPYGKPDPACFLMAARRFDVAPAGCLVFEDSTAGVRAAKAAGMRCVALRRPGQPVQNLSGADEILTDLADFDPAAHGVCLSGPNTAPPAPQPRQTKRRS